MLISVICANHGRDTSRLRASIPKGVEYIEVNRGLERSVQRNMAIRESKGDIIIWMDSDQAFGPGTVEECEKLLKMGYTAVFIPEVIVGRSFFGRVRAFERTFYDGTAVDVPRAVLRRLCPFFDETLHGPEDADWGRKIPGIKAVSKSVLYHYDGDTSFLDYYRKKAYYTKSMRRYAELNPDDRCLDLRYRCFWVFVENNKYKKILNHPFLFCCIIGLIFIRGIIYLWGTRK